MNTYPAYKIITLYKLLEADGSRNPGREAQEWADQGWHDPSAAYREWSGLGITDPDLAWELHEAGVKILQASEIRTIDGIEATIAAHVVAGRLTVGEAVSEAGVDPLRDLALLAQDRTSAVHALTAIGKLAKAKAKLARERGASVADIAKAFGVSRPTAYDLVSD